MSSFLLSWFSLVLLLHSSHSKSLFKTSSKPYGISMTGSQPGCDVFFPLHRHEHSTLPLLASPEQWTLAYARKLNRLQNVVNFDNSDYQNHSRRVYLTVLKGIVTGTVFKEEEVAVTPLLGIPKMERQTLDMKKRKGGTDFTGLGMTMVGLDRIDNIHSLLLEVFRNNIPGGFMETGVWRGGASIFARAVMRAYNQAHRISFVCDSFRGLPPSVIEKDTKFGNWDNTPFLEVSDVEVTQNFLELSLLDESVVFVKGFFNATMPVLKKMNNDSEAYHSRGHARHHRLPPLDLAILRMDGDMYQSTVDVLYNMYDSVAVGGFVIVDDWTGFPAKEACLDFFRVHDMQPTVKMIDETAAYWRKEEQTPVQYWRYEQSKYV